MREIKFRAWEKIDKRIYWVDYIDLKENCRSVGLYDKDYIEPMQVVNGDNVELMQFTGLHDKNGNPIYEGDIVNDPQWGNSEVKFINASFVIKPINSQHWVIGEKKASAFKICGNIYQNPELLK